MMETINDGNAMKAIIKDFERLGYSISYKLLKVSDFEVPQKRERVIIIGAVKDILPKFNFDNIKQKKACNVYDAINDIANYDEGFIENHK